MFHGHLADSDKIPLDELLFFLQHKHSKTHSTIGVSAQMNTELQARRD